MGYETRLIIGWSNDAMRDNEKGLDYLASLADMRLGWTDVFNNTYLDKANPGKKAFIYEGPKDTVVKSDKYGSPLYLLDANAILALLQKSETVKCKAAAIYLDTLLTLNNGYMPIYCVLYGY